MIECTKQSFFNTLTLEKYNFDPWIVLVNSLNLYMYILYKACVLEKPSLHNQIHASISKQKTIDLGIRKHKEDKRDVLLYFFDINILHINSDFCIVLIYIYTYMLF